MNNTLEVCVFLAGLSLIALSIGSLAIPKLLNWRHDTKKLPKLLEQVFWTYAVYILGMNSFFGIIATVSPTSLLDGSFLAKALTLYMSVYWLGRIFIQLFIFDKSNLPPKGVFRLGEVLLFLVFVFTSITFSWAFYHNLSQ